MTLCRLCRLQSVTKKAAEPAKVPRPVPVKAGMVPDNMSAGPNGTPPLQTNRCCRSGLIYTHKR